MYRIKKEFVNRTRTFKNRIGANIYFNGYNTYSQAQLEKMSMQEGFDEMIEWVETEADKNIQEEIDDLNITFITTAPEEDEILEEVEDELERVNTIKIEEEVDYEKYSLSELRGMFPDIKSTSKKDFISKIGE